MKKLITTTMLFGLTILLAACTGGGRAGVGVYHHHHGYGPWWGCWMWPLVNGGTREFLGMLDVAPGE